VSEFDCGFWISDFRIQVSGVPPQADQVSGIQGLSNSGIEGLRELKTRSTKGVSSNSVKRVNSIFWIGTLPAYRPIGWIEFHRFLLESDEK
jgi:hypothetical protein